MLLIKRCCMQFVIYYYIAFKENSTILGHLLIAVHFLPCLTFDMRIGICMSWDGSIKICISDSVDVTIATDDAISGT